MKQKKQDQALKFNNKATYWYANIDVWKMCCSEFMIFTQ